MSGSKEVEKYRLQMRSAIMDVLPEQLDVQDDASQVAAYLSAVLEVAVGMSVQIWGNEQPPHFLSEYINKVLEK